MKSIKPIVLGVFVTLCVFCAILYSSCSKSVCSGVTCLHYSQCNGGICGCKDGTGGTNCEKVYKNQYLYTYKGTSIYSTPTYGINGTDSNNSLTFEAVSDTPYNKMKIRWTNPATPVVISLPVIINNSSANGSNFTIVETTVDTLIYNGTGSVNGTTASLSLTKVRINNTSVKTLVQFNDFNKSK